MARTTMMTSENVTASQFKSCQSFFFQDDIKDPVNDRLTLAERNERLQNQLKSLKEDLVRTIDIKSLEEDL